MKVVSFALAILFLASASTSAQSGATGTWRIEGTGTTLPWTVVLRSDGTRLGGTVSSCDSVQLTIEIFEGAIDGNTIGFKCQSGDGKRIVSLRGTVQGDEIRFTWDVQVIEGSRGAGGLFGTSAPDQFTVKRVAVGVLPKIAENVSGRDLAAAVNLLQKGVKAEGKLFLPPKIRRARLVLVVIAYGLGFQTFEAREWSRLSEALEAALLSVSFSRINRSEPQGLGATDGEERAAALLSLLERFAHESGHQELIGAPLVFWGHSLAGSAAAAFAGRLPSRTIAFVTYQINPILGGTFEVVSKIPALLLSGGKDSPFYVSGTETLWKRARMAGAPWTFAIQPDATHGDPKSRDMADDLVIPWITAVLRARLSPDSRTLRSINDTSAWLGNLQTGATAPYATLPGPKQEATWLPDEQTARGWSKVVGAVKSGD